MRVLIIEDEHYTAQRLIELIHQYDASIEICGVLEMVSEAINWFLENKHPDLVFQDIQLKDGICFEIFEKINCDSPVVFTTAYSEYAIRSFEVNSIEYLVKPYSKKDIFKVFQKLQKFRRRIILPEVSILKELLSTSAPL